MQGQAGECEALEARADALAAHVIPQTVTNAPTTSAAGVRALPTTPPPPPATRPPTLQPDYLKPLDSNFVGQYENLKTLETLSHPFVVLASTDEQRIYRCAPSVPQLPLPLHMCCHMLLPGRPAARYTAAGLSHQAVARAGTATSL